MDTVETTFKKWQFHWGFAKWQKYSKESTLNGCWYFLAKYVIYKGKDGAGGETRTPDLGFTNARYSCVCH